MPQHGESYGARSVQPLDLNEFIADVSKGAATSMEDGAFLARCLAAVVDRRLGIADAISVYEKGRMPKASYKQQVSFLNGWLWLLPDGPAADARDRSMEGEIEGRVSMRSANLYGDPGTVLECYGYDAESDADDHIGAWLNEGRPLRDATSTVARSEAEKIANWFLPDGHKFEIRPRM